MMGWAKPSSASFHSEPCAQRAGCAASSSCRRPASLVGCRPTWPDVGDNSGWLGGTGESSERGPYYLDGLIGLAHQLRDPELIGRSQRWVDALLASQRADGSFGPTSDADWWSRMVAIKALAQQYDAVRDARIVDFLGAYFAYQLAELPRRPLERWGKYRAAENALVALWYMDLTGDQRGTAVARLVLSQGADWAGFFRSAEVQRRASNFEHFTHAVNVAMALKESAVRYLLDGDEAHIEVWPPPGGRWTVSTDRSTGCSPAMSGSPADPRPRGSSSAPSSNTSSAWNKRFASWVCPISRTRSSASGSTSFRRRSTPGCR